MLLSTFFIGILLCHDVFAIKNDDMAQYQNKLEELQKSIQKVQQHLKGQRKKRSSVVTELHNLEKAISDNTQKIIRLENKIFSINRHRKDLENDLSRLDKQLKNQKSLLTHQIQSAYSMGEQQQIKLLLNQKDPAKVGRIQTYFSYLNEARQKQIATFLQNIKQKQYLESELQQTLNKQTDLLTAQKTKKQLRQKQRIKRKSLVTKLNHKIKNQEKTLSNLETSRGRIENLLKSLGELLADIPAGPPDSEPFKTQKGQLPWPTEGKFLAKYGQAKNQGNLKWKGVLIAADFGTPIHAISHGRVAFADWLQGFGFITILDHGEGYMSLYGHSESLFKQVGDWVLSGEVIATAGDSGGQPSSGVYFEIRSRGKPINPEHWCKKKN